MNTMATNPKNKTIRLSACYLLLFLLFSSMTCGHVDYEEEVIFDPQPEWTFAVYGNSISTYAGTMPLGYPTYYSQSRMGKKNMWWAILGQKTKSAMIANSSWSGATVAFHQALDSISFFYSDYRIASLARNGVPNVIFVLGGTNDWNRSIPLGNVTDVDKVTTVCGAYSLMVRKLKRFYPNSTIILCGILPRKQGINTKNRSGWTIKQGNNAIREIAETLQVAYIDMEDCGMAEDILSCTLDGLHPNEMGMRMIADKIIEAAKSAKLFNF